MIGNSLEVSNFNRLFSNSIGSSITNRRFSPSNALWIYHVGMALLVDTKLHAKTCTSKNACQFDTHN